ncbi:MAG: hypothetical protein AAF846_16075 [Chloroflexota bacterium]
MATQQEWITSNILKSEWQKPLRASDLSQCFFAIKEAIEPCPEPVHILFDIRGVPSIPTQAPLHFVKSELPKQDNLGLITVIGLQAIAKILAQMASHMSGQPIVFFPDEDSALAYIQENA